MELISDPKVKKVFDDYPKFAQKQMLYLRDLVLSAAAEIEGLKKLEETLKWGEPSYLTKYEARSGWIGKRKTPDKLQFILSALRV